MPNTSTTSVSHLSLGKRLKLLRSLTSLTAEQLAKLSHISRQSISYWENGGEISSKSADKIVKAIVNLGYDVSVAWLLFGVGDFPTPKNETHVTAQLEHILPSIPTKTLYFRLQNFQPEIDLFKSRHKNAVVITQPDMSMFPAFIKTDIIAGVWHPPSAITKDQICIIEFNKKYQLRLVKKISADHFTVSHLNFDSSSNEAYNVLEIPLTRVAPVMRLWRHNDNL